jgi:hypothetical protein
MINLKLIISSASKCQRRWGGTKDFEPKVGSKFSGAVDFASRFIL